MKSVTDWPRGLLYADGYLYADEASRAEKLYADGVLDADVASRGNKGTPTGNHTPTAMRGAGQLQIIRRRGRPLAVGVQNGRRRLVAIP